jgi:hypothetical protein
MQAIRTFVSSSFDKANDSLARGVFRLRQIKNPRMRQAAQSEGYTAFMSHGRPAMTRTASVRVGLK